MQIRARVLKEHPNSSHRNFDIWQIRFLEEDEVGKVNKSENKNKAGIVEKLIRKLLLKVI